MFEDIRKFQELMTQELTTINFGGTSITDDATADGNMVLNIVPN